ncbi:hypothetical protein CYLTODRAFT_348486 [Cylindrobasidium torrendii FP15055 ss-10]|uniref:Gti1/Pac2 family-domain-containing protein n=1 Tax=Cylindrobasidium torrendii FP15055 ss-10 TaxID=1314674 RepID=A0A0D7BIS7_9AGAR|nr:hypothetical protein CYLTODRAFT_348486 [Cylindrobasidium torrendii FP15055 ss-10]
MAPRRSSSSLSAAPSPEAFHGYVDTTLQALHLVYAAHKGIIPRITRRLNETERRTMIRSGATFVFSVDESGIKRWTDGMVWSPSRIVGNFLASRLTVTRGTSRRAYDNSHYSTSPHAASHGSEQGTFKPDGLIKKTITVTLDQTDLHLISYYTMADWRAGRLDTPLSRQDIMALELEPRKFRVSNFRMPPKIEKLADGREQFVQCVYLFV